MKTPTASSKHLGQVFSAVFGIGHYVRYGPGHTAFNRKLSHWTIFQYANPAGVGQAAVGVYEHLDLGAEMRTDFIVQLFGCRMGFVYIEIPWHSQVAINMINRSISDNPKIM